MGKKQTTPTKVESIRHKDKRANIPTEVTGTPHQVHLQREKIWSTWTSFL